MPFSTDGKGKKLDDPESSVWYHGSPSKLGILSAGSSVTRSKELAIAFSHKPTILSVSDDGRISHNGRIVGYLYQVDEIVSPEDVSIHPACRTDDPWEWVTHKSLRLRLIV